MTIFEAAKKAHDNASKRGFYGTDSERAIQDKLDEELDEIKEAIYCQEYKTFPFLPEDDNEFVFRFERFIKNTVGAEFADLIITAMAGAEELNIPIEKYIEAGLRFNTLRKY